jgi:DNA-binding CsgD family transcriptional regulator
VASEILTSREAEFLGLLADGQTYAEIGRSMGISLNTVRCYVRAVYVKLGVETRAQAVRCVPFVHTCETCGQLVKKGKVDEMVT